VHTLADGDALFLRYERQDGHNRHDVHTSMPVEPSYLVGVS
jgi:hypothetical protein